MASVELRASGLPELFLGSQDGEAGFADDALDECGQSTQSSVRRLAELAVVGEAAVDFLGVLVALSPDIVGAWLERWDESSSYMSMRGLTWL